MHNLLIVDDEPFITNGLRMLFTEEMSGEVEAICAYNGGQALEKLAGSRIDIALLDINLPDISGVELHKTIIKNWPFCKVIFLTGLDDFTLIKSAIRNKAVDYLLKDEGDEAVIHAVKKALDGIRSDEYQQELVKRAEEQVQTLLPLLQNDLLKNLLGGYRYSTDELARRFHHLGIRINPGRPYMLLLAKEDLYDTEKDSLQVYRLSETIKQFFCDHLHIFSMPLENGEVLCLLQPNGQESDEEWLHAYTYMSGTLDILQSACKSFSGHTASFALLRKVQTWEQLPEALEHLRRVFYSRYGFEKELLMEERSFEEKGHMDHDRQNAVWFDTEMKHWLQQMEAFLQNHQAEKFAEMVKNITGKVAGFANIHTDDGMKLFYVLAQMVGAYIRQLDVEGSIGKQMDLCKINKWEVFTSWAEVENYFSKMVRLAVGEKLSRIRADEQSVIHRIHQFIAENLGADISLSTIAKQVHFNPFYLSRLYRQLTGKGLSEYIMELRITTAKSLLQNTNTKISDIVENLGFTDSAYFTRFFKKNTGMTPSEYRDQWRR